jgi:hypothetical protein
MCIRWGKHTSAYFKVSNGVRQGSLLSPKLFSVYVDQLSVFLMKSKVGCFINSVCFNHIFYADDLCLLAPSAIALQKLVNTCHDYGMEFDITYNPLKSVCMVFKPKGYMLYCPVVKLGGEPIEYVNSVKYLGVLLSSGSADTDDMKRQIRSLYARGNMLIRKFNMCSEDVKLHLFKTYCTGFYCAHLWSNYTQQTFNKVKVAYNNAFRFLLKYDRQCSARSMLVMNNVPYFDSIIRKSIYDFRSRVNESGNALVITLRNNFTVQSGAMFTGW